MAATRKTNSKSGVVKETPKSRPAGDKSASARTSRRAPREAGGDFTSDAALRALPADYAAAPDMPISVALSELASLGRLSRRVSAALVRVGISAAQLETLGRFVTRLRQLEAGWQAARAGVKLSAGDRHKRAEAEALRSKLVAGGRWALRKDGEAQAELTRITEGAGLEDTIEDLHDLVAFWRTHPRELGHTDITAKDLSTATALATALTGAAEKETSAVDAATALDLRNRCYWAADELSRELREGGRYAFRSDPKIAAKFISRYQAAAARRSREKKSRPDQPAAPAPPLDGG